MQALTRDISFLAVGRLGAAWRTAHDDYIRRLGKFVRVEEIELRQAPLSKGPGAARQHDSNAIIERLDRSASASKRPTVLVADARGRSLTSEQLAEWVAAQPRLVAVVGGAGGLTDDVLARADLTISFGELTFPHELARVMLVEQLYRSMKILRGEPYHW